MQARKDVIQFHYGIILLRILTATYQLTARARQEVRYLMRLMNDEVDLVETS